LRSACEGVAAGPGTPPPAVSLGRAPNGHFESLLHATPELRARSTVASRFLRWKRPLLAAGALVTKCTSLEDNLNAWRDQPGWLQSAVRRPPRPGSGGTNVRPPMLVVAPRGIASPPALDLELGRVWSLYSGAVISSA